MAGAIRVDQAGGPDVLRWVDLPDEKPGPGQVLLRQTAIGVNFVDCYQRSGLYPMKMPFIPGGEAAGVVEAVGEGVSRFKAGDEVAYGSLPGGGGYSQKRLAPAERLIARPNGITDKIAASIMLKGITVESLIRRCVRLEAGQTILVHAAAGGVGTILCQWASALGVNVIGTAGSAEKVALAKSNGAAHCINYRTEDFVVRVKDITGGKGVDVVYDSIGKDTFPGSLDCLRPRGQWVVFGQSSGVMPPLDLGMLAAKGSIWATRMTSGHYTTTRADLELSTNSLFEAIAKGWVRVKPSQEFALRDAEGAHRALEGRATTGSSILIP